MTNKKQGLTSENAVEAIQKLLGRFGFKLSRIPRFMDLSQEQQDICRLIQPYTMTSRIKQLTLIDAVHYICRENIAGAFVECGVWRGGSAMAMAETLRRRGNTDREIYLFDTYEGMPEPGPRDGRLEAVLYRREQRKKQNQGWIRCSIEDVQQNLALCRYPSTRLHFIKGMVEDTIPEHAPENIALLRLDTDWYESTKHELIHLFPRVSPGGILILDDYGAWQGCHDAVDEYFAEHPSRFFFLHKIDETGRLVVNHS